MKRKILPMALCCIAMLLLILDSRQAAESARESIVLCIRTVIPSLFPFFFLSACLSGSGGGNILFAGLLGGYPVGAQAVSRSGLDTHVANRMLTWCSQAGPSFIFGIAGARFPGMRYGWYLWGIQLLSALSVGWLFSGFHGDKCAEKGSSADISAAMGTALRAMASVCGWVVIFRVILGFLDRWFFFFLPEMLGILLSGLLELTNGCLMLDRIPNMELRFLFCLIFLNFGGFCVVLQTISLCGRLDIRYYLLGKLLQTGIALLFGCVILGYWQAVPLLILIFSGKLLVKARKNSSNPALLGV